MNRHIVLGLLFIALQCCYTSSAAAEILCVDKSGSVKIRSVCKKKERSIQINIPGPQGPKGDTGATGAAGAQSSPGATGATGPAGAKGEKGDKGEIGATGPKGDSGATGVGIQFVYSSDGTEIGPLVEHSCGDGYSKAVTTTVNANGALYRVCLLKNQALRWEIVFGHQLVFESTDCSGQAYIRSGLWSELIDSVIPLAPVFGASGTMYIFKPSAALTNITVRSASLPDSCETNLSQPISGFPVVPFVELHSAFPPPYEVH